MGTSNMTQADNTDVLVSGICDTMALGFNFGCIVLCCIIGLLGNTISIFLLKVIGLNNASSFLLQTLAAVDNVVITIGFVDAALFMGILKYYLDFVSYEMLAIVVMKFLRPCLFAATTASVWITVLLAINRYIAICKPLKAKHLCTKRKTHIQVVIVCILSGLLNIPRLFHYDITTTTDFDPMTGENITFYQLNMSHPIIDMQSTFMLIYDGICYNVIVIIFPILFLIYANVMLLCAVKRSTNFQTVPHHAATSQTNRKINILMVVIIMVVIVCQIPNRIYRILLYTMAIENFFCPNIYYFYSCVTTLLLILNSSVNFIVYIWLSNRFRDKLKYWFSCGQTKDGRYHSRTFRESSKRYTTTSMLTKE